MTQDMQPQDIALAGPGPQEDPAPRKPRIALMGEFSAGKSTLTNLLLGGQPLPVRVTATRLPPVWIAHGHEAACVIDASGAQTPIALDALDDVSVETAAMVRVWMPADALELCDLIDMPGISDPNMPAGIWQALVHEMDSVIWCTHATQAWRQSEAAAWESIAPLLGGPNVLLLTHFDKLRNSRDRERVLKRIMKEAGSQFGAVFPLSLSEALAAGDDMDAWKRSGADAFVEHLVEHLVAQSSAGTGPTGNPGEARSPEQLLREEVLPAGMARAPAAEPEPPQSDGARVLPRRVRPESGARRSESEAGPEGGCA